MSELKWNNYYHLENLQLTPKWFEFLLRMHYHGWVFIAFLSISCIILRNFVSQDVTSFWYLHVVLCSVQSSHITHHHIQWNRTPVASPSKVHLPRRKDRASNVADVKKRWKHLYETGTGPSTISGDFLIPM